MQSSYRPWHRPLIGVIILLLCSVGVYDFLMIHMGNEAYMNSIQSTGDIVAYFSDYPILLSIIWGINVFAGFGAALLLLLRSRFTVSFALASLVAMVILDCATFGFRDRWNVFGPSISLFDLSILLITLGFYFYTRSLSRKGAFV